jgi:polyisoprenoid-binding protein YceI
MRRLAFLALPLLMATPLVAQMAKPGSKNPAAVTGGTYTVDPNHTLIGWHVDHLGFSDYFGIFGESTGTLVLDPKAPSAAKVDITIPVSKVTTANAGLTAHLTRAGKDGTKPDFFGANAADAHFISTSVIAKGMTATITGNLTLNGVTKPVMLNAEFSGAGKAAAMMGGKENVGFRAKTVIRRSDYGMSFLIPLVSDEVALDITVAFQK